MMSRKKSRALLSSQGALPPVRSLSLPCSYVFRDPSLLEQALTHRSAGGRNNERMEFLGDALLGVVIAEALYAKFPDIGEGQLSRLRNFLVNGATIAEVARDMGLGEYIRLGQGERKSGDWRRDSILGDALEALFAAIHLDAGFECCRHCILEVFRPLLETLTVADAQKDAKTRLQEYLHAEGCVLPSYAILRTSGPDHAKMFETACTIAGVDRQFVATGTSKRRAEQAAADLALVYLQTHKGLRATV